jgi:hypothetical protein
MRSVMHPLGDGYSFRSQLDSGGRTVRRNARDLARVRRRCGGKRIRNDRHGWCNLNCRCGNGPLRRVIVKSGPVLLNGVVNGAIGVKAGRGSGCVEITRRQVARCKKNKEPDYGKCDLQRSLAGQFLSGLPSARQCSATIAPRQHSPSSGSDDCTLPAVGRLETELCPRRMQFDSKTLNCSAPGELRFA